MNIMNFAILKQTLDIGNQKAVEELNIQNNEIRAFRNLTRKTYAEGNNPSFKI